MLDIKLIRDQPDLVRERLAARGAGDESKVAELLVLDERCRKALAEAEAKKKETKDFGDRRASAPLHFEFSPFASVRILRPCLISN